MPNQADFTFCIQLLIPTATALIWAILLLPDYFNGFKHPATAPIVTALKYPAPIPIIMAPAPGSPFQLCSK